jgi:hypothetical protein
MDASADADYVSVLFETLAANDARARRLAAAIDWLDLAWRNTTSIDEGTRILLLKAGFEALLAAGDSLPLPRERRSLRCSAEKRDGDAGTRPWTVMGTRSQSSR